MAGPGGGHDGVGVGHRIPQLARVAFEECPTAITELGVQRAVKALVTTVTELLLKVVR